MMRTALSYCRDVLFLAGICVFITIVLPEMFFLPPPINVDRVSLVPRYIVPVAIPDNKKVL